MLRVPNRIVPVEEVYSGIQKVLVDAIMVSLLRPSETQAASVTSVKSPILSFSREHATLYGKANLRLSTSARSLRRLLRDNITNGEFTPSGQLVIKDEESFTEILNAGLAAKVEDGPLRALITTAKEATSDSEERVPWDQIPLDSLPLRFVLLSAIYKRTGQRLPDSLISKARTIRDLKELLEEKPLAFKRVAEVVEKNQPFHRTRNVTFRRAQLSRKEKDIRNGKWALIEAELKKRGLPLRLSQLVRHKSNHGKNGRTGHLMPPTLKRSKKPLSSFVL